GTLVFLMAGQGEFANKFYLYDQDWTYRPSTEMPSFSAKEISDLFSSGQLMLVRGHIPATH
ncbi:MAG: hypothetical protein WAN18_27200, partial [Candidatus Sulfotelmatobacter sp.]